jgi:hypothetical protein
MNYSVLVILMILVLTLTACAPSESQPLPSDQTINIEPSEEAETGPSREAVYIYNEQSASNPAALSLQMNTEPVQVGNTYIRLVGIIEGLNPVALVEVNGKGASIGLGERVGGYCLTSISRNAVQLKRAKDDI